MNIIQKRLQFDVRQTYNSVMENRWLTGAKHLHSDIQQKRQVLHSSPLPTRPYAEWMQIEPNISNLAQGSKYANELLYQLQINFDLNTRNSTTNSYVSSDNYKLF